MPCRRRASTPPGTGPPGGASGSAATDATPARRSRPAAKLPRSDPTSPTSEPSKPYAASRNASPDPRRHPPRRDVRRVGRTRRSPPPLRPDRRRRPPRLTQLDLPQARPPQHRQHHRRRRAGVDRLDGSRGQARRSQAPVPKSIADRHAILHGVVKWAASPARKDGPVIASDPCAGTILPKRAKRSVKPRSTDGLGAVS